MALPILYPQIYHHVPYSYLDNDEIDYSSKMSDTLYIPLVNDCTQIEIQKCGGVVKQDCFRTVGYDCLGLCYLLEAYGSLAPIICEFFRQDLFLFENYLLK
jgi:hypothetical protein